MSITNVLSNALLLKGITQHEFVGVSFIEHSQRKYQIWIKKLFVFAIKPDLNPFVNIMSVKIVPFQVLCNMDGSNGAVVKLQ